MFSNFNALSGSLFVFVEYIFRQLGIENNPSLASTIAGKEAKPIQCLYVLGHTC